MIRRGVLVCSILFLMISAAGLALAVREAPMTYAAQSPQYNRGPHEPISHETITTKQTKKQPVKEIVVDTQEPTTEESAPGENNPFCLGDFNNDAVVNNNDVIILTGFWGACAEGETCLADIAGEDGKVNIVDLLKLLSLVGPCPPAASV